MIFGGSVLRLLSGGLLFLSACHSGGGSYPQPPSTPSDLSLFMAQSIAPDGNPATPLHASEPLTYRRHDIGGDQIEDTFLVADGAITSWSYPPHGAFNAVNGDGGEHYFLAGNAIRLDATQDGGKPGVQRFLIPWTLGTTDTMPCAAGWTQYNQLERGCRAVVSYPELGPVESLVSEHGDANQVERIFLGRGWGRLAWQTFRPSGLTPVDRCPDFGWNAYPGMVLTDCRIVTHAIPADGSLIGAQEWHP